MDVVGWQHAEPDLDDESGRPHLPRGSLLLWSKHPGLSEQEEDRNQAGAWGWRRPECGLTLEGVWTAEPESGGSVGSKEWLGREQEPENTMAGGVEEDVDRRR